MGHIEYYDALCVMILCRIDCYLQNIQHTNLYKPNNYSSSISIHDKYIYIGA